MIQPENYTTYKDIKGRYWVVVGLDYWHLDGTFKDEIQKVLLYQVGTIAKIERLPYGVFLNMVETKKMILYSI